MDAPSSSCMCLKLYFICFLPQLISDISGLSSNILAVCTLPLHYPIGSSHEPFVSTAAYERICNELTGTLQPTFRARNMFYKSLQAVSDTVVDIQIKPKSSFLKEIALLEQDKGTVALMTRAKTLSL